MSYIEKFPSLESKPYLLTHYKSQGTYWQRRFDVVENCLDKQRVREAIEKIVEREEPFIMMMENQPYRRFMAELKKELGL